MVTPWQHKQPQEPLVVAGAGSANSNSNHNTTPISYSDTKQNNDGTKMPATSSGALVSDANHRVGAKFASDLDRGNVVPSDSLRSEAESAPAIPTSNLMETARQQQDLEFFRRFLQPSNINHSSSIMGSGRDGLQPTSTGHEASQLRAINYGGAQAGSSTSNPTNDRTTSSASIIDHLLPQMGHSNLPMTPAYTLPLMYSTFGTNYQADSDASPLLGTGLLALQSNPSSPSSSSSFYESLNSSSHPTVNSNRMLHSAATGPGGSLLDSYNNHLLSSDSSLFASEPHFASGQTKAAAAAAAAAYSYQRHSDPSGSGRTYSSVLNSSTNPALSAGLFDGQRAQQQQTSTVDGNDLISSLNSASTLAASVDGAHYQHLSGASQANSARFLGASLASSGSHQHPSYQTMGLQHSHMGGANLRTGNLVVGRNLGGADRSNALAASSSFFKRRNKLPSFATGNLINDGQSGYKSNSYGSPLTPNSDNGGERFSRKVFVGGLPPDIDEEEIKASFRRFGSLAIDWPHKAESKSYFPPKGYAFLLFQEEPSVQALIDSCFQEEDKLYLCVSSPTIKDKPVQIRPWRLSDTDYVLDSTLALDPRKTVFVGGVPRPLKACELANIMNNLYGSVCYAGIDTDPELKYPKGAGRVAFSSHQSYIAAISARFVHIRHSEIEKRVEVKPYVLDDQFCDECRGARCGHKFAPFFCANITCLRYYCDHCWSSVHSQPGREFHKPLVKEGGDRPRPAQSLRW